MWKPLLLCQSNEIQGSSDVKGAPNEVFVDTVCVCVVCLIQTVRHCGPIIIHS